MAVGTFTAAGESWQPRVIIVGQLCWHMHLQLCVGVKRSSAVIGYRVLISNLISNCTITAHVIML
jgi:hypothetical protein